MIQTPGIVVTVLSFLATIGPLIFIHELGHYFAGRAFGVKADAFSIGFGREIVGFTDRRGTRWKFAWLPVGGYVKFAGDMNPASTPTQEWLSLPAAERAKTFQAKPLWQRFIIVAAGPITNFLFAIVLFCGMFVYIGGEPVTAPIAVSIRAGSAAQAAGIEPGDRVVSLAGRHIDTFEEIADLVQIRPGQRLEAVIARRGQALNLAVTPRPVQFEDRFGNKALIGQLGIVGGATAIVPLGPLDVVGASLRYTTASLGKMVAVLGQIATGRRSVKEMSGPAGMARIAGEQATLGWFDFAAFMAMISINLGFINLLPVPMLDGGHLLFYVLEGLRRRPIAPQVQEWAFRSGLAALLTLMLFVTFNDLGNFGLWTKLAGLIG